MLEESSSTNFCAASAVLARPNITSVSCRSITAPQVPPPWRGATGVPASASERPTRPPAYGKCSFDCRSRGGYCGDGIVQSSDGEVCDLGTENGGYGPGSCAPGCKAFGPRCGDNKTDVLFGEECDDGNQSSKDGCSSTCKKEGVVK